MIEKVLIPVDRISDHLLSSLDSRDLVLWIRGLPKDLAPDALIQFLGLPWRAVLSDWYDPPIVAALESAASSSGPMARKRGFVQVVDGDPSRIELPQRCLPFYLLNGRHAGEVRQDFSSRLRRLTMLEELRRSGAPQVLVVSIGDDPIPVELEKRRAKRTPETAGVGTQAPR